MLPTLKTNYKYYLMEALGLFIFMVAACFFNGMLEHKGSSWNTAIPNPHIRLFIMATAMALTAAFIFFSPLTEPSGAFINPAVTLVRWRLNQLSFKDAFWYMLFQTLGGLVAVYSMAFLMGNILTAPPVNYSVTVPGKNISTLYAAFMETATAFGMMLLVLFTAKHPTLKKYTPVFAAILVGIYVMLAGPVSGFGMNPARTIASAVPAHIYTSFWIYMICPVAGMMLAAEVFLLRKK